MSLIAGACIAFAVWVVASPSDARAGCGHVALSNADRELFAALASLDGDVATEWAPLSIPGRPDRRPCSGPSCSKAPAAPTSPTLPSAPTTDRWLCNSALTALNPLARERIATREETLRPTHRPATLERPPRFNAA